jgi:hypothetical protein
VRKVSLTALVHKCCNGRANTMAAARHSWLDTEKHSDGTRSWFHEYIQH